MNDSYDQASFREGWLPVGRSREVTLAFQHLTEQFDVPLGALYYFKPLSTFAVPALSEEEKFLEVDAFICAEFRCDPDEVFTLGSDRFGRVILVAEPVLRRALVRLPRWGEPPMQMRPAPRLALVPR